MNTTTSTFIAQLLAPLPEGEEQADTPSYRRQVERDITRPWDRAMLKVKLADARHTCLAISEQLGLISKNSRDTLIAYKEWQEAISRQCLIPAPTEKQLRWKKRESKWTNPTADVLAAIAADERRFA